MIHKYKCQWILAHFVIVSSALLSPILDERFIPAIIVDSNLTQPRTDCLHLLRGGVKFVSYPISCNLQFCEGCQRTSVSLMYHSNIWKISDLVVDSFSQDKRVSWNCVASCWNPVVSLCQVMELGKRNRAQHCTNLNDRSSRSHMISTIQVPSSSEESYCHFEVGPRILSRHRFIWQQCCISFKQI